MLSALRLQLGDKDGLLSVLQSQVGEKEGLLGSLRSAMDGKDGLISDLSGKVASSGILEIQVLNTRVQLDDKLFDADAFVVHAGTADYKFDPAGAAGPRVACGVIRK